MKKILLYQVDAFTKQLFSGNPAGVCPLEFWLEESEMQAIAMENNLSETAFFVKREGYYELRWFTPEIEVDLCGHATLAAAHVIFEFLDETLEQVEFRTKSGPLIVKREGRLLSMDFPARPAVPCKLPHDLLTALGTSPQEVLRSRDYLVVYGSEQEVRAIDPDMSLLSKLDCLGVIITAPAENADFVSRFFAPKAGVPEDPVTGSAHCTLVPYWSEKLGKKSLHALQVSKRGGELYCEYLDDRVKIAGEAVTYFEGVVMLPRNDWY